MFNSLKAMIGRMTGGTDPDGQFDETESRLAVAALMIHCMAVDREVTRSERAKLRSVLMDTYSLSEANVEKLIAEATRADNEAVDLYGFTSVLKRHLDREQRADVIEQLWSMVYADGTIHEFEDNLVWRVAELLGIERTERLARKRAAREGGTSGARD